MSKFSAGTAGREKSPPTPPLPKKNDCRILELNQWPAAYKAVALPTELMRRNAYIEQCASVCAFTTYNSLEIVSGTEFIKIASSRKMVGANVGNGLQCRIQGRWIDLALLVGSCVAMTITLLHIPRRNESQEYEWCVRLGVLLAIGYTFTIILWFAQVQMPLGRLQNWRCRGILYAALCGVQLFNILLMGISSLNAGKSSRDAPCVCDCMSSETVSFQIAWLSIVFCRIVTVLGLACCFPSTDINADIAPIRDQSRGLIPAELANLKEHVIRVREGGNIDLVLNESVPTQTHRDERNDEARLPLTGIRSPDSGSNECECCAICLDAMHEGQLVIRLDHCTHVFHAPCIRAWLVNRNQVV